MKSLKKIALVFSCMALLGAGSAFAADAAQSSPWMRYRQILR